VEEQSKLGGAGLLLVQRRVELEGAVKISCHRLLVSFRRSGRLVFASSVQSGFLPPKRATVDRNRSRTDPHIAGTEPDHLGPVYFGPWDRFKPIQTGFFR
jgi:hypothetical protein